MKPTILKRSTLFLFLLFIWAGCDNDGEYSSLTEGYVVGSLVASYYIIKEKVPYQELGASYLLERKKKNKIDYLKRQLKELGYNIEKIEEAA